MLKYLLSDILNKSEDWYHVPDPQYGRSAPPLPLDIETFNWLYIENNEVKYTEVPVAVIYCDSVSWDCSSLTRNNNGCGTVQHPFKNLFNAVSQARYWIKHFCNLRVKIIVSGYVDYVLPEIDWRYANKIVLDWSNCTFSDDKNPFMEGYYHVGAKVANGSLWVYDPEIAGDDAPKEKIKTIFDGCVFSEDSESFNARYSVVMNNCQITGSDFFCYASSENENNIAKIFNSQINVLGDERWEGAYFAIFDIDTAINCNIHFDPRITNPYVTIRGELINCTENIPD